MLSPEQQKIVTAMLQDGREKAKARRTHELRYSQTESLKAAIPNRLARVPFVLLSWYITVKMLVIMSGNAVITTAAAL